MRSCRRFTVALAAACAVHVAAWPQNALRPTSAPDQPSRRTTGGGLLGGGLVNGILQPLTGALAKLDLPTPQPIGVALVPDADHPYQDPPAGSVRGMCPTMNALANHGYISRDGITTLAEAANACQIAFGFGYDLCTFLSVLGLYSGGDLATGIFSIGGADPRVPNTLGPSLGLSHHGPFEGDLSMTRSDAYFGNPSNFNLTRWQRIVDISGSHGGLFSLDTFAEERPVVFNESVRINPEFDQLVTSSFVARAQRIFTTRGLGNANNGSAPSYDSVAPFFLNETFPENWYRRGTPYSLVDLVNDDKTLESMSPEPIGANEGVNNFIPMDTTVNSMTTSEYACLIAMTTLDLTPGQLSPVAADAFSLVTALWDGAVMPFFSQFNCNTTNWTAPGKSEADNTPGKSAEDSTIVNGVYQR